MLPPPPGSTVGKSVVIEEDAERLVRASLPKSWRWRKQIPDIFLDYKVEVVDEGEPTGQNFALQVKGVEKLKRVKHEPRFRMKRKPLLYYRDKAQLPVFIACVDVSAEIAYWVFAQEYLLERAASADLTTHNSLTLNINPADTFSDLDRFLRTLDHAGRYVRDIYPGSPRAAIKQREDELQALDPQVGVKVSFANGREVVELRSEHPLLVNMQLNDPRAISSFRAMVEHGNTFNGKVEVLSPLPSPILEELFPSGQKRAVFEPLTTAGSIKLSYAPGADGTIQLYGAWRRGIKSAQFNGELDGGTLGASLKLTEWMTSSTKVDLDTPLTLAPWQGQALLHLPWFDEICALVQSLAAGRPFAVGYFIGSIKAGTAQASATPNEALHQIKDLIEWIARCRETAIHFGINPVMPMFKTIDYQAFREADILHSLARGQEAEDCIAGQEMCFGLSETTEGFNEWREQPERQAEGSIKLFGTKVFNFLGQDLRVDGLEQEFISVRRSRVQATGKSASVTFVGQESAVWIHRMAVGLAA